jgi:hypothetical protein
MTRIFIRAPKTEESGSSMHTPDFCKMISYTNSVFHILQEVPAKRTLSVQDPVGPSSLPFLQSTLYKCYTYKC